MKRKPPTFAVFNKILLDTTKHADMKKVFDPFKLITVLAHVNTQGQYEDDHYIVSLL